jgi:hypothetical protein
VLCTKERNSVSNKQKGKIYTYDTVRRFGRIIDGQNQRYFFHRDAILVGPEEPHLEQKVLFLPSTKPALPGKLPIAREIELLEDGGAL